MAVANKHRQKGFEPICNDFGNHFINGIVEANGAKILKVLGFRVFWDKTKKSVVRFWRDTSMLKSFLAKSNDMLRSNIKKFLVEKVVDPVQPGGIEGFERIDFFNHFEIPESSI